MMSALEDNIYCGVKKGLLTLLTACMLLVYWSISLMSAVLLMALRVSVMPLSSD